VAEVPALQVQGVVTALLVEVRGVEVRGAQVRAAGWVAATGLVVDPPALPKADQSLALRGVVMQEIPDLDSDLDSARDTARERAVDLKLPLGPTPTALKKSLLSLMTG